MGCRKWNLMVTDLEKYTKLKLVVTSGWTYPSQFFFRIYEKEAFFISGGGSIFQTKPCEWFA